MYPAFLANPEAPAADPTENLEPLIHIIQTIGAITLLMILAVMAYSIMRAFTGPRTVTYVPTPRSVADYTTTAESPSEPVRWDSLENRLGIILEEYTAAELDPATLLDRPLLLDVTYSCTAAFHDRREEATTLVEMKREFERATKAVDRLQEGWGQLLHKTYEIGIPGTDDKDKRQARHLLSVILDPNTSVNERTLSRKHLDGILNKSALNRRTQGALRDKFDQALALTGRSDRELTTD